MSFESSSDPAAVEGTFEYIEAKIRRDADGTAFGGDFEWLCKWFLETHPGIEVNSTRFGCGMTGRTRVKSSNGGGGLKLAPLN